MDDLSEKEQLDLMRAWWSENGRYVIGGVVLGVAILLGWNQWRSGIVSAELEASAMYETVMTSVGEADADAAIAAAEQLFSEHPDTVYTSQGRLAIARLYMDKGRDLDAANVLQDLVAADGDSEIGLVGRLRLAKVLLYQEKPEDVIALLEDKRDNAFAARYNELLGDAYVALGSYAEAEAAYNAALNDPQGSRTLNTSLVQLKINDLPELTEAADAADSIVVTETPQEADTASVGTDENAEAAAEESAEDESQQ